MRASHVAMVVTLAVLLGGCGGGGGSQPVAPEPPATPAPPTAPEPPATLAPPTTPGPLAIPDPDPPTPPSPPVNPDPPTPPSPPVDPDPPEMSSPPDDSDPSDGTSPPDDSDPSDGTSPPDGSDPSDGTSPPDGSDPSDGTSPPDGSDPSDGTSPPDDSDPSDGTSPPDGSDPSDGTSPPDDSDPSDGTSPPDGSDPSDGTSPPDGSDPSDGTSPPDGSDPSDGTSPPDGSDPSDGTSPPDGSDPSDGTSPPDGSDPSDGTSPPDDSDPSDGTSPPDGSDPSDGTSPPDDSDPSDGTSPPDGSDPSDGTSPPDGSDPSDGTSPPDDSDPSDGTSPPDGSDPSDGTSPPDGSDPSDGTSPPDGPDPSDGTSPPDGSDPSDGTSPPDGSDPPPSPSPPVDPNLPVAPLDDVRQPGSGESLEPANPSSSESWETSEYRFGDYVYAATLLPVGTRHSLIGASEGYAARVTGEPGGGGITVAVVDGGVDFGHPELDGDSFTVSGSQSSLAHGTSVAGVIAARRDGQGMHGVAYNANLVSIAANLSVVENAAAIASSAGLTRTYGNVDSVPGASSHIVNISRGAINIPSLPDFTNAMQGAAEAGRIMVASLGNCGDGGRECSNNGGVDDGLGPSGAPAANVADTGIAGFAIAVGSLNEDGTGRAAHSNTCGSVSDYCIFAPGENVPTTTAGGGYNVAEGTSFAAPYVSGAAAVVWGAFPNKSGDEIVERLLSTADSSGVFGDAAIYGQGKLDLGAAMNPVGFTSLFVEGVGMVPVTDSFVDLPPGFGAQRAAAALSDAVVHDEQMFPFLQDISTAFRPRRSVSAPGALDDFLSSPGRPSHVSLPGGKASLAFAMTDPPAEREGRPGSSTGGTAMSRPGACSFDRRRILQSGSDADRTRPDPRTASLPSASAARCCATTSVRLRRLRARVPPWASTGEWTMRPRSTSPARKASGVWGRRARC